MEQSAKPPEAPKPKSRTMLLAVIIVAILVVVGVGVYLLLPKSPTTADVTITIWDGSGCPPNCGFKDSSGSPNITISVGSTVQWKNTGALPHTATSCDPSHATGNSQGCPIADVSSLPSFDTGTVAQNGGTSSIVTFSQAGTYYYYCSIHAPMHGKIVVQ